MNKHPKMERETFPSGVARNLWASKAPHAEKGYISVENGESSDHAIPRDGKWSKPSTFPDVRVNGRQIGHTYVCLWSTPQRGDCTIPKDRRQLSLWTRKTKIYVTKHIPEISPTQHMMLNRVYFILGTKVSHGRKPPWLITS